jgi:hypothetical protein
VAGVEEEVAVREDPQVVAIFGRVFPLDRSFGGDDEHFSLGIIRAGERVTGIFRGAAGVAEESG